MKRLTVAVAGLAALAALTASAEVDFASFLFSTDGGETWREEYPLLTGTNRTFALKVEWTGHDDRKMVWGGLLGCTLSSERDFASSQGRQHGSPLFWQAHDLHYKRFTEQYLTKTPRPFVFHVDLDARADKAKVHPRTKKELPACTAYGPGTWYFTCHLRYHLETPDPKNPGPDRRLIEATRTFFVYIDDPKNSVVEGL